MKEPDLSDDDIESHLEIKIVLSGRIAWMLTYAYGARVGGMAGLPKQRKQRREMDGISEPNLWSFVLGLCGQVTAGWRSPDRSGQDWEEEPSLDAIRAWRRTEGRGSYVWGSRSWDSDGLPVEMEPNTLLRFQAMTCQKRADSCLGAPCYGWGSKDKGGITTCQRTHIINIMRFLWNILFIIQWP